MSELTRTIYSYLGPFSHLLSLPVIYLLLLSLMYLAQPFVGRILFDDREYAYKFRLRKRFNWPLAIGIWSALILSVESQLHLFFDQSAWDHYGADTFAVILILALTLSFYRVVKVFSLVVRSKYDISEEDNLRERKILTQIQFIEKITFILLFILAGGLIFLRFESLATFGSGVLASAGIASVVIGFAAQESVSNLIAGFQIAFTQPLRLDDAVVVEGEWGWIEEITLTYVVIRIWDQRRLVTPIKYFTTKPFQNWTRENAKILGSVVLYLDYRAPVEKIREAFERIVSESKNWDKDVKVLQVIDATEKTIQLRGLMSGVNSPTVWNLRCEVREKLITYIQQNCPEALPQVRILGEIDSKTTLTNHDQG